MASNKEHETWILLALASSDKRSGLNRADFMYKLPEDIWMGQRKLFDVIDGLEGKKLIQRSKILGAHLCITKDGSKELDKRLNDWRLKNNKKYLRALSYFPDSEIKQRILVIEKFIINSLISFIFFLNIKEIPIAIQLFFPSFIVLSNNPYNIVLSGALSLFFVFRAMDYFSTMILFSLQNLGEDITLFGKKVGKTIKDFSIEHETLIKKGSVLLVVILVNIMAINALKEYSVYLIITEICITATTEGFKYLLKRNKSHP